jgi:PAS domain S-box-containing protein
MTTVAQVEHELRISTLPMWVFDQSTLRILEVNQAASQKYGYSRTEFLALTVLDLRPSSEIPAFLRSAVLHPHATYTPTRWCHKAKDSTLFDVEITSREIEFRGHKAEVVTSAPIRAVESMTTRSRALQELQK